MQQRTQRSGTERTYVNTRDVPKLGYFLEYVREVLNENGSSAIIGGYQSHTHPHGHGLKLVISSTYAWKPCEERMGARSGQTLFSWT